MVDLASLSSRVTTRMSPGLREATNLASIGRSFLRRWRFPEPPGRTLLPLAVRPDHQRTDRQY